MDSNDGYNRREIIEKGITATALGSLGFAGTVPASAADAADEVETLLDSKEVKAIERADPELEIRTDEAVLIASGDGPRSRRVVRDRSGHPAGVTVPTNHGELTVVTLDGDRTALLDFDERVPEVESDWPDGTTGRLKATGDVATFQRTATPDETDRILAGIRRPDLTESSSVEISVAPGKGEFYVLHVNESDTEVERLRGRILSPGASEPPGPEQADPEGRGEYRIIEAQTHAVGDGSGSLPTRSAGDTPVLLETLCDCDKAMADVIFCVYQAAGCLSCFIGSPAPPVLIACLILVCAGGTGGVFLSLLGNLGCLPPSDRVTRGCVSDCIDVWV